MIKVTLVLVNYLPDVDVNIPTPFCAAAKLVPEPSDAMDIQLP